MKRILQLLKSNNYEKPNRAFWWLKPICNLNCNHCSIGKNTDLKNFKPALNLKDKKQVVDHLYEWLGEGFSLSFIAGEPFLHKDMLDIISHASKKGIITSVTSNGTLTSQPLFAKKVVLSGLNFLAFSLDSVSSNIHDRTRGRKGVRRQVSSSIKNIQEAKKQLKTKSPAVYINTIIMKENLKEIPELVKWAKKEKIDGVTFQPIANPNMFGEGGEIHENWFETSSLWPKTSDVLKLIEKLEKMKLEGYPLKNSKKDFKKFVKYFKDPISFAEGPPNKGELKSISITSDGYLKMCPSIQENFGNILTEDLDRMWRSKLAKEARKHILSCKSQCKILANSKEDFYF